MKGRKFTMNWRIWRKPSEHAGSKCTVSIVARTGYGLGSGHFARPHFGTDLAGNLGAEKNQDQRVGDGMVNERRSRYQ